MEEDFLVEIEQLEEVREVYEGLTIQDLEPYFQELNYHIQLQNTISLFFVAILAGSVVCMILWRFLKIFF